MHDTAAYNSFLLRLWLEETSNNRAENAVWQIEMSSIQSGESWRFSDLRSLITFLEETFPSPSAQSDD